MKCYSFVIVRYQLIDETSFEYCYFDLVPAYSEKVLSERMESNKSQKRIAGLIGAVAPLAIDLVGNLLGSNSTYENRSFQHQ
jgi:hypothetical protein